MALPNNQQQRILDYDFDLLQTLKRENPGATYNIGLRTLTREPQLLDKVPLEETPWLLQTDGDGECEFKPSSYVAEQFDTIYLGYVKRDNERFPGISAPELRRLVLADVTNILDKAQHRLDLATGESLVGDWQRTWEVFDDPLGEWSLFILTERVSYTRQIIL